MKIFNWIHGKIHGKQPIITTSTSKSYPNTTAYNAPKEEFSDWPNGILLTIGTFGSNKQNHTSNNHLIKDPEASSPAAGCDKVHQQEPPLTAEEVGELHKELKLLMHKHSVRANTDNRGGDELEQFFDCLDDDVEGDGIIRDIISSDGQDCSAFRRLFGNALLTETTAISRKSLSFFFKKAILCRGGFASPHIPRPPLLPDDARSEKSRMDKILRSILQKKIYPQGAAMPRTSQKMYKLEDNSLYSCGKSDSEVEDSEEDDDVDEGVRKGGGEASTKWVKTDSDFIVLEL
ncbi:unnamed protein product [Cuscuta epithymum]|uniref:Uncharacterized protein n=1 Tax=Cuscuta epithymum TaxID=186058 RepID=A0AAV0F3V0_9ASTE|nr:unnamed protein product [Cuscuta epithymum]